MAVLRREQGAPDDLREKSLRFAGAVLELTGYASPESGQGIAQRVLDDGSALRKFEAICAAQGGLREPPRGAFRRDFAAPRGGRVSLFDNRRLARAAKLAGAPGAKAAGVDCLVRLQERVEAGQPLYTIHAETPGELAYAGEYALAHPEIIRIEPA
jgi:thymidine phosphorylase